MYYLANLFFIKNDFNNNNNHINCINADSDSYNNNNIIIINIERDANNEIIRNLEDIEITEGIIDKAETKECPICLIEYSPYEKICYLPCFHFFHSKCIKN